MCIPHQHPYRHTVAINHVRLTFPMDMEQVEVKLSISGIMVIPSISSSSTERKKRERS